MHCRGVQDRAAGLCFIPTYRENLKIEPLLQMQVLIKNFFTQLYGSHRDFGKNPLSINIKVGVYFYLIFFLNGLALLIL